MSGLRRSRNIPIEGHVSAHGMPDRPCVVPVGPPRHSPRGESNMRISSQFRAGLIGLIAIVCASASSPTYADVGTIRFSVLKAGWFIGGSGGRGELIFHGRRYPLTIGGLSAGLVFGAAGMDFVGAVSNIFRPSDVAGV